MTDFLVGRGHFDNLADALAAAEHPRDVQEFTREGKRPFLDLAWYASTDPDVHLGNVSRQFREYLKARFVGWTRSDHQAAHEAYKALAEAARQHVREVLERGTAKHGGHHTFWPEKERLKFQEVLAEGGALERAQMVHFVAARFRTVPQFSEASLETRRRGAAKVLDAHAYKRKGGRQ